MKRLFPKTLLVLISLFLMTSAYSASYKNISALGCKAVFLDQAFDLKWDSIRLTNRHASLSRWVVCPIPRTNSSLPEDGIDGYVNYLYSGTTNFATPNGTCIFREIDYEGSITYSKTVTLSNPGAGATNEAYFSINAGNLSNSNYTYWTMSCKLPPQTSVMSFDMYIED